jgi:hypothetical protein
MDQLCAPVPSVPGLHFLWACFALPTDLGGVLAEKLAIGCAGQFPHSSRLKSFQFAASPLFFHSPLWIQL